MLVGCLSVQESFGSFFSCASQLLSVRLGLCIESSLSYYLSGLLLKALFLLSFKSFVDSSLVTIVLGLLLKAPFLLLPVSSLRKEGLGLWRSRFRGVAQSFLEPLVLRLRPQCFMV